MAEPADPRPKRFRPGVLAVFLLAGVAAASASAVYFVTRSSDSRDTASRSTAPPARNAGLAAVVPAALPCAVLPAALQPGAVETAICREVRQLSFSSGQSELSVFRDAQTLRAAYDELRRGYAVGRNFGACYRSGWHGEAAWTDESDRPAGRRFCAFDGSVALIVWTHEKLRRPNRVDTLGTARGARDHAALFFWWQAWRNQIGRCAQPRCVARLP